MRHLQQPLDLGSDAPDGGGNRAVAVVAVELDPHVERQNVAFPQTPRRGNPVDDLVVHRRTHRRRKPAIALEGR
jgi:hypothetical protein